MRRLLAAVAASLLLLPATAHAKPTIVLVHGAFADASGFADVTGRLQDRGYTVLAPANPLRDLQQDAAYVRSVLDTVKGPVVLVGHSYGGSVITEAGNAPNVKALVYVNGDALDVGESTADIAQRFPGGKLGAALRPRPAPEGVDLYVDPGSFRAVFAADLPARTAATMASAQRPVTQAALEGKAVAPAWKRLPTWSLIGTRDEAIPPSAQRFMAKRAKATTVEIVSSHASYLSHPRPVADLILRAARRVH
jgi:pimeloyl-ACP methyl ester carboxylesterase